MSVVKINLDGLKRFRSQIEQNLRGTTNGPIRAALRQWGARFRGFIHERYSDFSRGGGGWRALDKKTIAHRRKGKGGGGAAIVAAILVDTGTLKNSMDPKMAKPAGSIQQDVPFGVLVGYGGPARHPKGNATIADIAHFHQSGAGNLPDSPARTIIVPPSGHVQSLMAGDMERGLVKLAEQTKL